MRVRCWRERPCLLSRLWRALCGAARRKGGEEEEDHNGSHAHAGAHGVEAARAGAGAVAVGVALGVVAVSGGSAGTLHERERKNKVKKNSSMAVRLCAVRALALCAAGAARPALAPLRATLSATCLPALRPVCVVPSRFMATKKSECGEVGRCV